MANFILWQVVTEPLYFLKEQKVLPGIKQRAEAIARVHPIAAEKLLGGKKTNGSGNKCLFV